MIPGTNQRLLWPLCLYQFLMRGVINTFFVTSQTGFFAVAGVVGLPYVYAFMNGMYIALQALSLARLRDRSADYIVRITWILLGLFAFRVAWPATESVEISSFFLLLVMIFDLFFSQFFSHFLNEIFPVQEGKSALPVITGFASLSFIVSGLFMKLALAVLSLNGLMGVGLLTLLAAQLLFIHLQRRLSPNPDQAHSEAVLSPQDPTPEKGKVSALGWWIVGITFFNMLGKYWLDYQYSRAITREFTNPKDLAGFMAIYSSFTDAMILLSQLFFASHVFKKTRLVTVLKFLPCTVLVFSLFSMVRESFFSILLAQFFFTFLAKAFHNSAVSLMVGILPSTGRLKTLGVVGMVASTGAMLASVSLIVVQGALTTSTAFALLVVVFLLMLIMTWPIDKVYSAELERALDRVSGTEAIEAIDSLLNLKDYSRRFAHLRHLLETGDRGVPDDLRIRAITQAEALKPDDAASLLLPLVTSDPSPKIRAVAAKGLIRAAGSQAFELLQQTLSDPRTDDRVKADILEAFGETDLEHADLEPLLPFLENPHHRIRSNAATAMVKLSPSPGILEKALGGLAIMIGGPGGSLSRSAAIAGLGRLHHEIFVPDFVQALRDSDEKVASQAITALGAFPLPGVVTSLEAFEKTTTFPSLKEKARRELQRLKRLTTLDLVTLLEALDASERASFVPALSELSDDATIPLLEKILKLEDPGLRSALLALVRSESARDWLPAIRAGLESSPPGSFQADSLTSGLRRGSRFDIPTLMEGMGLLLEHSGKDLYDRILETLLERLWKKAASRERLREKGISLERKTMIDARFEEEESLFFNLLSARSESPASMLDAIAKALRGDGNASSFGFEYLETRLLQPLCPSVCGYLRASRLGGGFVEQSWFPDREEFRTIDDATLFAYLEGSERSGEEPDPSCPMKNPT